MQGPEAQKVYDINLSLLEILVGLVTKSQKVWILGLCHACERSDVAQLLLLCPDTHVDSSSRCSLQFAKIVTQQSVTEGWLRQQMGENQLELVRVTCKNQRYMHQVLYFGWGLSEKVCGFWMGSFISLLLSFNLGLLTKGMPGLGVKCCLLTQMLGSKAGGGWGVPGTFALCWSQKV